ncbi:MAG: hypothetical protein RMK45_01055 [Armatimonadota bacterium]|nr:hypothetical protein [Armatimonadota bacterium]
MKRMRIGISMVCAVLTVALSWGIATEGRRPDERPEWWKAYENAPPLQVNPQVVPPKGDVPSVVEEAVTRNAPAGVPEHLVITPSDLPQGAASAVPTIDTAQVAREAARTAESTTRAWGRSWMLLGVFLLLGGGATFGVIRWLTNRLPEPPQPSRRRQA